MKNTMALPAVLVLMLCPPTFAACPDGTVEPLCNNVKGPTQVDNALDRVTQATTNLGAGATGAINQVIVDGYQTPEGYGAAHSLNTLTSCTTTGGSNQVTCPGGTGDFLKNHGVRIPLAGAATPLSAMAAPTLTVNGRSGSTTYTYSFCTADPYGGIAGCNTATTSTGNATLTLANSISMTSRGFSRVPNAELVLVYRKIGSAADQFVTAANAWPFYDIGWTPPCSSTGCGWPVTPPSSQKQDLFSYITAINGNTVTLNDNASVTLSGTATVNHDDTRAWRSALANCAGGNVQGGPYTYPINQSSVWGGSPTQVYYTFTAGTPNYPGLYGEGMLQLPSNCTVKGAGKGVTFLQSARMTNPSGQSFTFGVNTGQHSDPFWWAVTPANCAISNATVGQTSVTTATAACAGSFVPGDYAMIAGGADVGGGGAGVFHSNEITKVVSANATTGAILFADALEKPSPFGTQTTTTGTTAFSGTYTINVVGISGFASGGSNTVTVGQIGTGIGPQTAACTGTTATSFTGCTGGSGSLAAGSAVVPGSTGGLLPTVYLLTAETVHDINIRDMTIQNWSGAISGDSPLYRANISKVAAPYLGNGNAGFIYFLQFIRYLTVDNCDIVGVAEWSLDEDITFKNGTWLDFDGPIVLTEGSSSIKFINENIVMEDWFCTPGGATCTPTSGTFGLVAFQSSSSNFQVLNSTLVCNQSLSSATETNNGSACLGAQNGAISGFTPYGLSWTGNTITTNSRNGIVSDYSNTGAHIDNNTLTMSAAAENPMVGLVVASGTANSNYLLINSPTNSADGYDVIHVAPALPFQAITVQGNTIDVEAGGQTHRGIAVADPGSVDNQPIGISGNNLIGETTGVYVGNSTNTPNVQVTANTLNNVGTARLTPMGR